MGTSYIGKSMRRVEDGRFLTGRGTFTDDIPVAGALHVHFIRSPHAHATISSIDASAALAQPGVHAVFTAENTTDLGQFEFADPEIGQKALKQTVLARDKARFVGEPVVVVVADTATGAEDAAELVEIEYDPLPAVADIDAAMQPDAPQIHPDAPGNICMRHQYEGGDVDAAFERAAHVVKVRVKTNRVNPLPIEPRTIAAIYEVGRDELLIYAATQVPHPLRANIARLTGFPDTQIRVIAPDVGGGFGGKGGVKREELLVAYVAIKLKRAVRWVSTRSEDTVSTNQGRGLIHEIEAAADADGIILGLKARSFATPGGFVGPTSLLSLFRSSQFLTGAYRIPAIRREQIGVLTNTSVMGPNRGTGRPESILAIERIVDDVARLVGLDPLEVRRRNMVQADQFPYRAPTDIELDSGNYQETVDRAVELAGYDDLRREQEAARARGELMGIGISTCVGMTATGGWQSAVVRVEPSGRVTVMTGTSPHGQGHETVWAQVAAERLDVPFESVAVVAGDTARTPYGIGTVGTNGAPLGASSVAIASDRVREKILTIASQLLEVEPGDLTIDNGKISVVGVPEKSITLAQIARMAYGGPGLPKGIELGLDASARFRQTSEPYAFGAMIVVTKVDPETGHVDVPKVVFVDDCGHALNPLLLHGQTIGGVAWGLGQVMYEQVVYDDAGQPLTRTLLDYALVRASNMPGELVMDRTETPSPLNPLGAKGGAEGANITIPAAVYNGVIDALTPLGVNEVPMPLTPLNVWSAIQAAKADRPALAGVA